MADPTTTERETKRYFPWCGVDNLTSSSPAQVLEALRQMTRYARALRTVVANEGHSSVLGLARAQASIGDPATAIARATGLLTVHGVNIDG